MITQKEFLEIVEKHLRVFNDGSINIDDPTLAKKYTEYLKHFASKVAEHIESDLAEPGKPCIPVDCGCACIPVNPGCVCL